jgi:hypothetical protein
METAAILHLITKLYMMENGGIIKRMGKASLSIIKSNIQDFSKSIFINILILFLLFLKQ